MGEGPLDAFTGEEVNARHDADHDDQEKQDNTGVDAHLTPRWPNNFSHFSNNTTEIINDLGEDISQATHCLWARLGTTSAGF